MTVTLCTSGQVVLKAGANVSTDIKDDDYTVFINQAECFINAAIAKTGVDVVSSYASLGTNVKQILQDAASSHAAIAAINYDMSGYTSRTEAQIMMDVNYTKFNDCITLLKETNVTDYMGL
jgi:hypothetical protein